MILTETRYLPNSIKALSFLILDCHKVKRAYFLRSFLQPRSGCKIHDLLKLGLLLHINGVYRQDALSPKGFEG